MSTTNPGLETLPTITNNPTMLLGQIRHFVSECRKLLNEGEEPEIHGMNDQVKQLCTQVSKMDLTEAQKLRPRMDSLVAELDELAFALTKQRELVLAQLAELNRQQQANNAYQRAGGTKPPAALEAGTD